MNADKANVARLMALEAFKNVTAPFARRITARLIDIGTLVSAGSGSAGTTLYQIAQTNPLNIFVNVPQSNAPDIHEGLAAKLLVEEYPTRNFEARVIRTAAALDPASRTLNTELQIPNDDGALFAGMYAHVKFTLSDGNGPIIIPANAFVFKTEGPQVATLTKDGRIHWQKIRAASCRIIRTLPAPVPDMSDPDTKSSQNAGVDPGKQRPPFFKRPLTSYLVSNAIVLPMTGWLGMRFGRKRFLTICIALFTAASALCGAADNLLVLILSRILQGAAGGALQPMSQAILLAYNILQQQAASLAYVDAFQLLTLICIACIPFVFLLRNVAMKTGGPPVH